MKKPRLLAGALMGMGGRLREQVRAWTIRQEYRFAITLGWSQESSRQEHAQIVLHVEHFPSLAEQAHGFDRERAPVR